MECDSFQKLQNKLKLKISIENTDEAQDTSVVCKSDDEESNGESDIDESVNKVEFNVRLDKHIQPMKTKHIPLKSDSEYGSDENEDETESSSSSDLSDDEEDEKDKVIKVQEDDKDSVDFNVRLSRYEKTQPKPNNEKDIDDEDGDSDSVEFNVKLTSYEKKKDIETESENLSTTPQIEPIVLPPKVYKNKFEEFITGLDQTDEEIKAKRTERAKRFGIEKRQQANFVDTKYLYKSLEISEEDLKDDTIGYRLNTLHLRGVDKLSTDEVFAYFRECPASTIEWINDTACNVVWVDEKNCARALYKLSRDREEISHLSERMRLKGDQPEEGVEVDVVKDAEPGEGDKSSETAVPDDYDELDLCDEAGDDQRKHTAMDVEETTAQEADTDTASVNKTESESNKNEPDATAVDMKSKEETVLMEIDTARHDLTRDLKLFEAMDLSLVRWPIGAWRLGEPCSRTRFIFMRFANKDDVKLRGAEKRSKYYQRHGNPNYEGLTGLISNSKKKRVLAKTFQALRDGEDPDKGRPSPDYSDNYFDDTPAEPDTRLIYDEPDKEDSRRDTNYSYGRDKSVYKQHAERSSRERSPQSHDHSIDRKRRFPEIHKGYDEDREENEELQRLLGRSRTKRFMRMHADDEADDGDSTKQSTRDGLLTVTTNARRHRRLGENLPTDLRSRLGRRK